MRNIPQKQENITSSKNNKESLQDIAFMISNKIENSFRQLAFENDSFQKIENENNIFVSKKN